MSHYCAQDGSTALIQSIKGKNIRVAQILVDKGANKDAVDNVSSACVSATQSINGCV